MLADDNHDSLKRRRREADTIRLDRVERLRREIGSGQYRVDRLALAGRLLRAGAFTTARRPGLVTTVTGGAGAGHRFGARRGI